MTGHAEDDKRTFTTVDEFIEASTYDVEPRLVEMRRVIRAALPDADETISYNIPAYKQHGVVVVQFSGYTEHTSLNFFPTAGAFAAFDDELAAYKTSKSAIRFPLDEPLPVDLIGRIATFRLAEAEAFAARKKSGK
ncbi:iron chaperone [Aeromicrobium sp. UC242_57]|uniref:iron chaperone n=1 Tax=Aeromicrobium sp. UC242_57 TaxID=3374624 RepID=UPI00378F21D0